MSAPSALIAHRAVPERAAHAWEAANGWRLEPEYARARLAALLAARP